MPARSTTGRSRRGTAAPDRSARSSGKRLQRYVDKRDFSRTREPRGAAAIAAGDRFVIQKHAARRLHYDLRLELDGVLKSWAVPKGPSLDPAMRRLAVHVEDHPIEYADFEGRIPEGEYGAGAVIVWDRGTWTPVGDPRDGYRRGRLKFRLAGEKLHGGFTLARTRGDGGRQWLLIKERDETAAASEPDIVDQMPESVISGLTTEDLALQPEPAPAATSAPRSAKAKAPRPGRLSGARRRPLPADLQPQLPTLVDSPPDGAGWLHEIKYDGYRTLCFIRQGSVRLISRNGNDWTVNFPAIADALRQLPCETALLDGELVVQDAKGVARLPELLAAMNENRPERILLYVFDLLHLDGYDLMALPLTRRKRTLRQLVTPEIARTSPIQFSDHVAGKGAAFFAQSCRMGLEGIVSKRADQPYQPGRGRGWVKTKCFLADDFIIVGYRIGAETQGFSLQLAEPAPDRGLRFVGTAGTGFSAGEARRLTALLKPLRRQRPAAPPPATVDRKGMIWVEPRMMAEIRYATRTAAGQLRHASYQGLRLDKSAAEADPPAKAQRRFVTEEALAGIEISNPDRPMFGDDGPTKLDLALYYARVGNWMLPELVQRPISFIRCPSGLTSKCFYQRHALPGQSTAVRRITLPDPDNDDTREYLWIADAEGLFAMVQLGTIEFHPWGCRVDKPEKPDRMVFDLDPDEGLAWPQVVRAAHELREELSRLGLGVFLKTTGGKGLHLVVPLARRANWDEVKDFAQAFAVGMAARAPDRYTATVAKRARRGRIFVDYLRNGRTATAVAAYSLRARPGAPVATPISWDELDRIGSPAAFTYATVPERLASLGDNHPWRDIDEAARPITRTMRARLG